MGLKAVRTNGHAYVVLDIHAAVDGTLQDRRCYEMSHSSYHSPSTVFSNIMDPLHDQLVQGHCQLPILDHIMYSSQCPRISSVPEEVLQQLEAWESYK
ncbi:MAG: hypothetical protein ABIE94_06910 [archaeon]